MADENVDEKNGDKLMENENNENGFGFGNMEQETPWHKYIGKFISTSNNGNGMIGILEKIDSKSEVAYFSPVIVTQGNNLTHINYDTPGQMPLPFGPVYPLLGTIEEHVRKHNAEYRNRSGKDSLEKGLDEKLD